MTTLSKPLCKDFLKNRCTRKNCKFSHEIMADIKEIVGFDSQPKKSKIPKKIENENRGKDKKQGPIKGPPAVADTVVKKQIRQKLTLLELSYLVGEQEIQISLNETEGTIKEIEKFLKHFTVRVAWVKHDPRSHCFHPIDGKIIRTIATQRALSAALGIIGRDNKHVGVVNIIDLWGSSRTCTILNRACSKSGAFEQNAKLFTYKCLAGNFDAKDLLRSNGRDAFEMFSVEERLLDEPNCHVLLIQDVQQVSTSKKSLLDLVVSRCQVLAFIFHLETGPFGYNGYHGFYVKDDNGSYRNYASCEDAPYSDRESYEWLFQDSNVIHMDTKVTWCVQNIYGNVYFAIITKDYAKHSLGGSVEIPVDFKIAKLEVTNEQFYLLPRMLCCIDTDWVSEWMHGGKVYGEYYYHVKYCDAGVEFLSGQTFGPGLEKRYESFMADLFKKDQQLQILKKFYPEKYRKLVVFTIGQSKYLHLNMRFETSRFNVASIDRANLTNDWISGRRDNRLDRSVMYGCAAILASPCIATYYGFNRASALLGNCWRKPSVRITKVNCPRGVYPPEILADINQGSGLSFAGQVVGVVFCEQPSVYKRWHTQTPCPSKFRLASDGVCSFQRGVKKVAFNKDIITEFNPYQPKSNIYIYGPFMVGWHANQNSPGGAVGMTNALLTEVKLADGSYISVEESAVRGQSLYARNRWFDIPLFEPADCEDNLRRQWCHDHVKHAIYVPALEKVLLSGVVPNLYRLNMIPKTNELLLKDKERIIISGGERFVSYFGLECSILNSRFKNIFSLENWMRYPMVSGKSKVNATWGSGTTPEERGRWFDLAMTVGTSEAAITVCGDDLAAIANFNGIVYGIESDASNWDHSQILMEIDGVKKGMLNVEYNYYRKFGASEDLLGNLATAGRQGITWEETDRTVDRDSIRIVLGYNRRCSGLVDTTDGNTLNMAHLTAVILGDLMELAPKDLDCEDLRTWIMQNAVFMGASYGVKLKVQVHVNPRHMTFLKGYYVDARVEGVRKSIWYPSPEILMKLGTSESNPDNSVAYKQACKLYRLANPSICRHLRVFDILQSWKTFAGMPMLDALTRMVKPPFKGITYEDSRKRIQDLDKWDKPELSSVVTDQDFGPMLENLGIEDHVESFDRLVDNIDWVPGMFVTHPIIGILAQRYAG